MNENRFVIIRGGGDIATGVIYVLYHAGFRILITEMSKPSAIRRNVALCEAVYDGQKTVEDVTAVRCNSFTEVKEVLSKNQIPLLIDPSMEILKETQPDIVVDAILAKKNLGTTKDMAPLTIALGPGFEAGRDVDLVIETMRGHQLGRIISQGAALQNTGVPGLIAGESAKRVIHAPTEGVMHLHKELADTVTAGEVIAEIETKDSRSVQVEATLDGLLRGLIRDGFYVTKGFKIADIDPRLAEKDNCFTISDKSRFLGSSVLTAIAWEDHRCATSR